MDFLHRFDFNQFEESLMKDGILGATLRSPCRMEYISTFKDKYSAGQGDFVVTKVDRANGVVTLSAQQAKLSNFLFFARCANISESMLTRILTKYKVLCLTSKSQELRKLAEEYYETKEKI